MNDTTLQNLYTYAQSCKGISEDFLLHAQKTLKDLKAEGASVETLLKHEKNISYFEGNVNAFDQVMSTLTMCLTIRPYSKNILTMTGGCGRIEI